MVEHIQLGVNEEYRISTQNNSVVVLNPAVQKFDILDTAGNVVATLRQAHDQYTLPINSGDYIVRNVDTVIRYLYVIRFYVY